METTCLVLDSANVSPNAKPTVSVRRSGAGLYSDFCSKIS